MKPVHPLLFLQGYEGKIRIEVDGGVGVANIKEVAEAGADMFVAGSAILKVSKQPTKRPSTE